MDEQIILLNLIRAAAERATKIDPSAAVILYTLSGLLHEKYATGNESALRMLVDISTTIAKDKVEIKNARRS